MGSAYFKEEQGYASWILWLVGFTTLFAVFGIVFSMLQKGGQLENDPEVWGGKLHYLWVSIGTFALLLFVNLMLFKSRLILEIKDGNLGFRFIPFQFSIKKINPQEITFWEVRKANPLLESRGFGYKWGINKRSIIMKGTWVLELKRKKGPKLLLGTQKPEELKREMNKLMNPEEEF